MLCKTLSINSYRPKINNINAPEIPGKNIALMAKKPPRKTYPMVGVMLKGIRTDNKIPINNPIKVNNSHVNICKNTLMGILK